MVKLSSVLEVEIDAGNRNYYFRPLQRKLRGRFDVRRLKGSGGRLVNEFPDAIPGQRLGIDVEAGEAYLCEPLHAPEHTVVREGIERQGFGLPPERETFQDVDVATWLHWLKLAVEAGHALVIKGDLPETIQGKPQLRFHSPAQPGPIDRLAAGFDRLAMATERQSEVLNRLLTELLKR